LNEAEAGLREVFFVDAAHFVYGAFLSYLWCVVRLFVPTGSGRQRLNVLGAVGYASGKVVVETNCTTIRAPQVCSLLRAIRRRCPRPKPVTVVLDNARYQRNADVFAEADRLGIELLHLPPYSPNLNLIERVWKLVKKLSLAARVLPTFNDFKESVLCTVNGLETKHRSELRSLLTPNFQDFAEVQVQAA
jgi:transposase